MVANNYIYGFESSLGCFMSIRNGTRLHFCVVWWEIRGSHLIFRMLICFGVVLLTSSWCPPLHSECGAVRFVIRIVLRFGTARREKLALYRKNTASHAMQVSWHSCFFISRNALQFCALQSCGKERPLSYRSDRSKLQRLFRNSCQNRSVYFSENLLWNANTDLQRVYANSSHHFPKLALRSMQVLGPR